MRQIERRGTATRRDALRSGVAALAARVGVAPTHASAAARPGAEADLTALCALVVETEAARQALCARRHTLEDERRTEPELQALYAGSEQALDRLMTLPGPLTSAGATAMARAALALAPRYLDGEIIH